MAAATPISDRALLDALPIGAQVRAAVGATARSPQTIRTLFVKIGYQDEAAPGEYGDWLAVSDGETSRWPAERLIEVEYPEQQAVWPPDPLPTEPGTVIVATVDGISEQKCMLVHTDDPWVTRWISASGMHWDAGDITGWRLWRPDGEAS